MAKVTVIGAGSWGIALAKLLHTNGHKVTVWSIVESEIAMLREKHEHVDKLPGVKLPEDMEFTTDLGASIQGCTKIHLYSQEVRPKAWRLS